ncbi:Na+/H+ antiporter NhaC-like protein [Nitzschia inconspicua]|uniref:Na+/H+ antiporter NhaC-like protein n=1 Tax=Nitzschia inconspicua TaxID=303405 RepID=A0A9K3Q6N1_9STRA|nr:Na+/H+ antiporter NhaC-like protein [Nitzschia inconspicua]
MICRPLKSLMGLLLLAIPVTAFDYNITSAGSLDLTDVSTGIGGLKTIFTGDVTLVSVTGVEWEPSGVVDGDDIVSYTTIVNGVTQATGTISLVGVGRELPTDFDVGNITVLSSGTASIEVILEIDGFTASTDGSFQVYGAGVSIIPLIFILIVAMTTQMVELSLFGGIWLGACIVTGSLADGFRETVSVYILDALYDWGHVAVILFTVFLSGTVGMMQKSGGMLGFTRDVAKVATTPRSGMFACFFVGIIIFFDDYSNVLLAGETMRPLLDLLSISREKLSFVVDATSAPIASISPISSWVGFEIGLLNSELEKINDYVAANGLELTIKDSGFAIFLQSIKYRYYPIFMLVLMMITIGLDRDFGPMLLAERQVRIYDRTDGGPNKGKVGELEGSGHNQPRADQPLLTMNMLLPVLILVVLIFVALVKSGDDGSGTQSFMDKIESSDSFIALLYGTMGTAWIMILFYLVQITIPGTGKLALPTAKLIWDMMPWRKDQVEVQPRFLMSLGESVEAFLFGMTRVFLALVVLALAWASGALMTAVGCDRFFAAWIVGGVPPEWLPTLSFLISLLMALATGTSWGTMSILFPLILLPTYISSEGDPLIFYAVVAGVLSGSVAGDHMSPISDTTVLTALACDVTLVAHVSTQAPYVLVIVLISVLFGTIPIGFDAWPNMVGIALGWVASLGFVYGICVPVISKTGRWDPFFKYCCGRRHDRELIETITADCIKKFNGDAVETKSAEEELLEDVDDLGKEKGVKNVENSEEDKPVEESPMMAESDEQLA